MPLSSRDLPPHVRSPTRPALLAAAWLVVALLQSALVFSVGNGEDAPATVLVFYGTMAAVWAVMTPAIAWWAARGRVSALARAAGHLASLAVVALVDAAARRALVVALGGTNAIPFQATLLYFADRTLVSYLLVVVVARALAAYDALAARTAHALTLRAQLDRARLDYLEAQLQPHFLFNAMATVAELTHEAPAAAARMLRHLAALLRFALDRRGEEVTLREELEALEPYLEIQRVRFADWLAIERDVAPAAAAVLVPRLVLQPLVENAIHHGLAGREARGRIEIVARLEEAARNGGGARLRVVVRDNGVGLVAGAPASATGGGRKRGIGLANVRERLTTLYGDEAELVLRADPAGGTAAELTLPAHRAAPAAVSGSNAADVDGHGADGAMLDVDALVAGRPSAARPWAPGNVALAVVGAWLVWGILWTHQSVAYLALRGRLAETSYWHVARNDFLAAALWAALTPVALWLARALPFARRRLAARVAVHLAAAVALGAGHTVLWQLASGERGPAVGAAELPTLLLDVLIYGVIVGVAHQQRLEAWLRERDVAASRLRADLAEAGLRAATVRIQPDVVFAALERIADTVERDPADAERALAALAEQLRAAVDPDAARGAGPEPEAERRGGAGSRAASAAAAV